MNLKTLSFLLFLVRTCGCTEIKNKLSQKITASSITGSWLVYDIENNGKKKSSSDDALLQTANDEKRIEEGIILSFFKDGSFTELTGTGNYQYGTWRNLGKDQIIFTRNTGVSDTGAVKITAVNGRQTLTVQHPDKTELKFLRYTLPLKDEKEDPFYSKNNSWRIKPQQQETPPQLQERLTNYIGHLAFILKSANERKQNVVSFQFSQGIVKIYSSGIGVQPKKLIPQTWTDTYFNSEDAYSAYKMFGQYLQTNTYKGAGVGNWIEDDYKILVSIYGDAKQGKFLNTGN